MIRKLPSYEEVAELFTVLLRRKIFRLTQERRIIERFAGMGDRFQSNLT